MKETTNKTCPECGEKLVGRVDKKFCSDQCRNSFNNRLNSDASNTVRNINNILRKNRRVLQSLNKQSGKTMVSKDILLSKGFNFTYSTHTYKTQKGLEYHFCYEQGYLFLEERKLYLLVASKDKEN
jgi:hypothetical protein